MKTATLTAEHRAAAPEVARYLCAIFMDLAALVASAFLKDPRRVGLIVPLWTRLTRAARRFGRLMDRVAQGKEQPRPARARPVSRSGPRPASLPSGEAWLVVALRHDGAAQMSRLQHLLSDPKAAELIASVPQAASILRPLCRMLGVSHPAVPKLPRHRPRRHPASPPAASTDSARAAARRSGPSRGAGTAGNGFISQLRPVPRDPPLRPLSETVPCPHVFWPWFPDKLRGG